MGQKQSYHRRSREKRTPDSSIEATELCWERGESTEGIVQYHNNETADRMQYQRLQMGQDQRRPQYQQVETLPPSTSESQQGQAIPPRGLQSNVSSSDWEGSMSSFHDEESKVYHSNQQQQDSKRRTNAWALTLFSLSAILLFADQNLMAPNLTAIATEFGFSEQERDEKLGGHISLAFFCLGAPASFAIGYLTDSYNRSILFFVTVGLGELACLATYFVETYRQLFMTRALTGLAMGGALPLIYSISGDLFPPQQRHVVSGLVGIGTGWGVALGQALAGFLGPTYGWRIPFLIISIPALICATLVLLTVPDPPRGLMEQQHQRNHRPGMTGHETPNNNSPHTINENNNYQLKEDDKVRQDERQSIKLRSSHLTTVDTIATTMAPSTSSQSAFATLLSTPSVILAVLQGVPGCLPWGIINVYLNDFLAQNRGMTVEKATGVIVVFGVGKTLGILTGGLGGSVLYRRDPRYPQLLAGTAAILGCFPVWILLNVVNDESPMLTVASISLLAGFLCAITGPIVKATLQNVCLPQTRGQAFALYNLFGDLGEGFGPVLVAFLIVNMGGRLPAFNVTVLGWMACGILNNLLYFTVYADEQKVMEASSHDRGSSV